ncbi:dynamin family protein [Staphylococcus durrellii]|uniref:dynamin family protein n=1 Tax=Staphylococcus durrellii TaxID=2781773 RepID=UPI00189EB098|nr:dynamin family protein [Staphylococcus durrellii]MBF7017109.1 dynamin family protein [Staphylococcus durrellii]
MGNTEQLDILYKLKKEVEKSSNDRLIHIINQVIKKVYLNQYTATFVGHFSAGKSTLINLLLEQNILPSSPVPTTSNTAVVSVDDEPGLIANLSNKQYTLLNSYDEVKQMNRQNVEVESIEIKFPSTKFNKGFTLQDTPGVDSNVSTHQSSTEQFMYTSNVIFYTVDYNHVQSALNFQFMKQLNQANVPIVFVINQIDKHNDEELQFDDFKQRVEKSVNEWDINLDAIFYVSKFEHPNNEINALSAYLIEKDKHREALEDYVERIVKFITEEQLSYIQNEIQDTLTKLDIEEEDFDQAYINFQQHQEVSEEAQLLNDSDKLYNFLHHKRKDILENAYIMTHDTRELIRNYLESLSKQFKVGGLFNKKKKALEIQEERLNLVIEHLQDKVNQQIRQPLREDMSFLTRFINSSEVNDAILNQHYVIEPSLITHLYKEQISISNQYVLTFCDEVLKAIQQFIKKDSDPLFKKAIQLSHAADINDEYQDDFNDYENFIALRNLRESLTTRNYRHYYIHIDDSLDRLIDRKEIMFELNQSVEQQKQVRKSQDQPTVAKEDQTSKIKQGLSLIEQIPLFEQTKQDISNTIKRMDNKIVKIGVFGTFSAGKSSLINALLGGNYLVSSPNPTTAAMTEISYGENSEITLKSEAQLLEELNNVYEVTGQSFNTIQAYVDSVSNKLKEQLEKNQLAFVNAIEKHYTDYRDKIASGLTHKIAKDEIKKWSAKDEYATFVNTVHLKLPLPWLEDKIIVDSLGLHSNNQRHTNETEKVLTSSDLILYVSYFNHAFTDNDKKFIEHMKDMNQLNSNQAFKMVINAVDLAETEEDLLAVYDYVRSALLQVNLDPAIYSVSSRASLKGNDGEMKSLRDDIEHFTVIESKYILQDQMHNQLQHISNAYEQMINEYETNKAQIEERTAKLRKYDNKNVIHSSLMQNVNNSTDNEVEDQLYHLVERLKIQLRDEVRSVFNSQMTKSSDFNEEKKKATKIYLDQIHQRLYLEQSLLVERIKKHFEEQYINEMAPIKQKLENLHVFITPEIDATFLRLDEPYLRVDYYEMLNTLPKSLTKKKLIQPNVQQQIQEEITEETIKQLQPEIADLREGLNHVVIDMSDKVNEINAQLEQEIQYQVQELLSFKLDDDLIKSLKATNKNLTKIL